MIGLIENRRILLLTTLLASALIAAALFTAIAPTAAATTYRKVEVISKDGVVELYEDGKLIKTLKAPEDAKHLEVSASADGKIILKFEMEASPFPAKDLEEKAMEIVKNSPRVEEVVGSDYEIVSVGVGVELSSSSEGLELSSGGEPVIVVVKASDGTCYRLTVDLDQGVVESIEKTEVCRIELASRAG